MKINTAPRSDQWNADDFVGSTAKTFTIANVTEGTAEGARHDIHLAEGGGRVWRPPVTMLRLLTEAWGDESDNWIGKRVTLYRDAKVRFGSDTPGGIRVSHMSDLPGNRKLSVALTATRGRRAITTVEPLPEAPTLQAITPEAAEDFQREIAEAKAADDLNAVAKDLKAWDLGSYQKSLQDAWKARMAAIKSQAEKPAEGEQGTLEAGQ
jgi:hypothetical protein